MPASFDWEFEEDPRPSCPSGEGVPPRGHPRRWLRWGAVLLILLGLAGLLARALVVQQHKIIKEAKEQLRAAVELELKTINDGDAELFRSLQDPSDSTWRSRQVARYISRGTNQFAPTPGLIPADRSPEIEQIRLSGRSGQVELTHWFRDSASLKGVLPIRGEPQPSPLLPFRVTWFYRQEESGNWLHVAPPENHGGRPYAIAAGIRATDIQTVVIGFTAIERMSALTETASSAAPTDPRKYLVASRVRGPMLKIRATQAEGELLDPIRENLGSLVVEGCERLDCPRTIRYRLRFQDIATPQLQHDLWALPLIGLTGVPENEGARAAWQRALKLWIVEALAYSQLEDQVLAERLIFRQLVVHLQAQLGLRQPPSPNVELLTEAVSEGRQHSLQELWMAMVDHSDPENTRLHETEIAALLALIAARVGSERLFEMLPVLHEVHQPRDAALYALYDLDRDAFAADWLAHLEELTGVSVTPLSTFPIVLPVEQPLQPPPAPLPPPITPDGPIALICDGRVWVGDAGGGKLVPLTPQGPRSDHVYWSPDYRWLVTR